MRKNNRPGRRARTAFGALGIIGVVAMPGAVDVPGVPDAPSAGLPTLPSAPHLPTAPSLPKPSVPKPTLPKVKTPELPSVVGILDTVLAGATGQSSKPPTAAQFKKMGGSSSKNGKLRRGCHAHSYHYWLKPRTRDWTVEVFLTDRRREHVASDALMSGADKNSGTKTFRICKDNTVTGTFKIRMRMTYPDGDQNRVGWLQSSTFKMTKP